MNSEFSYSCSTGTTATARGFHSSIGKNSFWCKWKDLRIFVLGIALLIKVWVFLQPKKKRMEEFFLWHNKIKKPYNSVCIRYDTPYYRNQNRVCMRQLMTLKTRNSWWEKLLLRNRKVEWNPVLVKYFISLLVQAEGKGYNYNLSWAEDSYLF